MGHTKPVELSANILAETLNNIDPTSYPDVETLVALGETNLLELLLIQESRPTISSIQHMFESNTVLLNWFHL